jgi:hypothetical protein
MRDLRILVHHGWAFVLLRSVGEKMPSGDIENISAATCVSMTKQIIGMRNVFIQTPYALYKKLNGHPHTICHPGT